MRKYKLVACDLDGTLLNSHSEVSSANLSAIKALAEKGVCFVPTTGRIFREIGLEIRENPYIEYVIYSSGAGIANRKTGAVQAAYMPKDVAKNVLDVIRRFDTYTVLRADGTLVADGAKGTEESVKHYSLPAELTRSFVEKTLFREDFDAWCYTAEAVEVISPFFCNDKDMEGCRRQLSKLEGLRVVGYDSCACLEMYSDTAGKDKALRRLADSLGISVEDTIGVGDSDNDIPLLSVAGLGLAVANACDALKTAADDVICSNNEDVLAYIAAHYF